MKILYFNTKKNTKQYQNSCFLFFNSLYSENYFQNFESSEEN